MAFSATLSPGPLHAWTVELVATSAELASDSAELVAEARRLCERS